MEKIAKQIQISMGESAEAPTWIWSKSQVSEVTIENLYSPSKHGRKQTISNTNEIKQLWHRQKTRSKLTSNLATRLAHNTIHQPPPVNWRQLVVVTITIKSCHSNNVNVDVNINLASA